MLGKRLGMRRSCSGESGVGESGVRYNERRSQEKCGRIKETRTRDITNAAR